MEEKTKKTVIELMKFGVGGGSAVLTDFIVYILLKSLIDMNIAKAISFVMGSIVGFIINKLWTFESRHFCWKEVIKYIILYAFSATVNSLVNKLTYNLFEVTIVAFLVATGVSTIINYLGQKFFVFPKRRGIA